MSFTGSDDSQNSSLPVPGALFHAARDVARLAAAAPVVATSGARLASELGRVAVGRSELEPAKGDRRFTDPTWNDNPAYRRIMQAYLATCDCVAEIAEDLDLPDWRDRERARFVATVLASALAPTNSLVGNPAALKRAFETGGASLVRGTRHLVDDLRHNGGLPRQVNRTAFTVGKDIAVTPGAVVYRDEVLELLQYRPSTEQVRRTPIVIVPPQINKYYFMDLAPGRSLIEFAVGRGQQVFAISWRNPSPAQRDWDLETYAAAILAALDAVAAITRSELVNLFGLCAGGITTAVVLNHLAAIGDHRVSAASFGVTLLDWTTPAAVGMLSVPALLKLARWRSRSAGMLDSRSLGSVFAWMRPNDLIWNYVVNNYLLGKDPPPFDILAWNSDGTNLPAALHRQFLEIFADNTLALPGEMTVLGTPVDLSRVKTDTYVTGGASDHLTPWKGCFASAHLLGGTSTFVLANTGHIQTLVCPPGNPKSRYWTGGDLTDEPEAWRTSATEHTGSWWEHWADWIESRSGELKRAPARLGGQNHPPLADAPGSYVR
jgi:polyhydroxyalkanoate synthase